MTTDERNDLLNLVLGRVADSVPYSRVRITTIDGGLRIKSGYDDTCRQCYMGHISASFEVTYDELANEDWDASGEMAKRWEAAHLASKATNRSWPYEH